MPTGGELSLSTVNEEKGLGVEITDQGMGMSPEVVRQIFEPFYTTKEQGQGRGLGLAVCQRMIDEAGGRIEVCSKVDRGTSFVIWLPRIAAESDCHEES